MDKRYVVIVRWYEPEDGVHAYGLFTQEEGRSVLARFEADPDKPEDLVIDVIRLSEPNGREHEDFHNAF